MVWRCETHPLKRNVHQQQKLLIVDAMLRFDLHAMRAVWDAAKIWAKLQKEVAAGDEEVISKQLAKWVFIGGVKPFVGKVGLLFGSCLSMIFLR